MLQYVTVNYGMSYTECLEKELSLYDGDILATYSLESLAYLFARSTRDSLPKVSYGRALVTVSTNYSESSIARHSVYDICLSSLSRTERNEAFS